MNVVANVGGVMWVKIDASEGLREWGVSHRYPGLGYALAPRSP